MEFYFLYRHFSFTINQHQKKINCISLKLQQMIPALLNISLTPPHVAMSIAVATYPSWAHNRSRDDQCNRYKVTHTRYQYRLGRTGLNIHTGNYMLLWRNLVKLVMKIIRQ
jgi:hypothetical protein